jgi:hypothetical protein
MAAAEYMRKKERDRFIPRGNFWTRAKMGYMHPRPRSLRYNMTLHEYSYKDFAFNFYDVGNLTEYKDILL